MAGKIYLIPTVLNSESLHVIPQYVHEITASLKYFFVEDERTTRRYLRKTGYTKSFDDVELYLINEHVTAQKISSLPGILLNGNDFGVMSEAGVPAVADPGHMIVKIAHENKMKVVPLVGPSSIILALMASGLNGQQFLFHGYFPVKQPDRIKKIQQVELRSKTGETQIFIETPYRNNAIVHDVLQTCHPNTLFCIASDLTGENESIRTMTVGEWRKLNPAPGKIPSIFLIGNFGS